MKRLHLAIVLIAFITFFSFSVPKKNFEKRFQVGFGALISTPNIFNLANNFRMAGAVDSLNTGTSYDNLTTEQKAIMSESDFKKLQNLSTAYQKAIIIANIFAGMEYSLQLRTLWNLMITEVDLSLLPMNGSYNGRLDFMVSLNGGIRLPYFIMPYITGGVNFTFQFYPESVANAERWKSNWGTFQNFAFRPGINIKAGLDFKFKLFSIGAYYQYIIKDFEEFSGWWSEMSSSLTDAGENVEVAQAKAAGMVFGAQSKFGISMCWYFF
ncbi:MAG: hypothetical protein A2015_12665 [Spirochaetes bacterium GWF1_31_7]|nr:MAG: hypothetical protein A2Y30_10455 [Spirochaetes bacterium GWE1_32_154]OHD49234.1 MAG: hypothetical protein A2Y29_16085 [Spirochaetes bacterium GWE2_31_10]OHD51796.1 MAG: hypothetical protein A2015_12665 [Spirochaetes bacterium GWF1_31_7]OHD79881.1 MAG: hypothetical protein A2355_05605 [Spirochaetes bacterium RIFOXYB1_FULL_32_8]HBD95347.1 hypothetical protein [Spirochaetia bacterium]